MKNNKIIGNLIAKGSDVRRKQDRKSNPEEDVSRFFADGPPFYERVDPSKGISMWLALFHFVSGESAKIFYELDGMGYGDEHPMPLDASRADLEEFRSKSLELKRLEKYLSDELHRKLRSGKVIAKGYPNSAPMDGSRQIINKDRWAYLDFDVRESSAVGGGVEIQSILIFKPNSKSERPRITHARVGAEPLRKWYVEYVKNWPDSQRHPSRDEDFKVAEEKFGKGMVTLRQIIALRRELAPASWKKPGRPKSTSLKSTKNA